MALCSAATGPRVLRRCSPDILLADGAGGGATSLRGAPSQGQRAGSSPAELPPSGGRSLGHRMHPRLAASALGFRWVMQTIRGPHAPSPAEDQGVSAPSGDAAIAAAAAAAAAGVCPSAAVAGGGRAGSPRPHFPRMSPRWLQRALSRQEPPQEFAGGSVSTPPAELVSAGGSGRHLSSSRVPAARQKLEGGPL